MNILRDSESEQIRGGALIQMPVIGVSVPLGIVTGIGLSANLLSEGSTATNTVVSDAVLTNLLGLFKL